MKKLLSELKGLGLKKERIRMKLQMETKLNPEDEEAHLKLSLYYLSIEDLPNALKHNKIAVVLSPENEHLWFLQGFIYESAKKYKYALEAYYFGYRLGSTMSREKLLSFSNSTWSKSLPPKEADILEKFKEGIC
jgi:tetratricopeptide (TPR) repeat protein